MEKQMVRIKCRNNGQLMDVPMGATLQEVYEMTGLQMEYGPLGCKVNNKVEGMHYRVYKSKDVEFLNLHSPSALRAYTRTLFFVLCTAAHKLWPDCKVLIDIPVSNGYYVTIKRLDERGRQIEITPDDVNDLRQRMQQLIDAKLDIHRYEATTEEAIAMFRELGSLSKVKLL